MAFAYTFCLPLALPENGIGKSDLLIQNDFVIFNKP